MSKPLVGVRQAIDMAFRGMYASEKPRCQYCGAFVKLGRPTSFETQRYICKKCGHAGLKAQG